jgi:hypothetical protein
VRRGGVLARILLLGALAAGLSAGAVAPASAAAAQHGAARSAAASVAVKHAPVPPAGVAVGHESVAKPRVAPSGVVRPMTAWTVTLATNLYTLWPTQYATLTATASSDVGPTAYYIFIKDADTNAVLAACGSGTTCSVAVTKPTATQDAFYAYVATDGNDDNQVAIAGPLYITWEGIELSLAANLHTLAVGGTSTLTATSDTNIGPTPFYIQIWDTTTDTLVNTSPCGSGTTCTATVSQSAATTHTYVASFGETGTTYPQAELQNTTAVNYIEWTASGMTLSLSAPATTYAAPETVTATANVNVGPTPYYIEIFNENGTLLDTCGSGTTCSFTYTPAEYPGSNLVAFISSSSSTLPPPNLQAVSNSVTTFYQPAPQ